MFALSRERLPAPTPQLARPSRALLDLWAAHRELSLLEWLELKQAMTTSVGWVALALLGGLSAWLALNAALLIGLRDHPLRAAIALVALNLLLAAVAGWRASRILGRPFFALTKVEVARDVRTLVEGVA